MSRSTIPCMLMRGGTSKGAYLLARDLPSTQADRDPLLLRIMGSPDVRQIDGLGGATSLTSKMAIVSASVRDDRDVDFAFAQIGVETDTVDTGPTCGNILSGVGPFAILRGLVEAGQDETTVRVWDVNTSSRMDIVVPTPGGVVEYEGDASIDGVPGTAAPILINFLDILGPRSGTVFPTGNPRDEIEGVQATCIDSVNPVVLLHADELGESGHEIPADLDADHPMLERLETIRRSASLAMGLGDAAGHALPKIALLSPPDDGGHICSRYFTPTHCHEAHAVSGAIAIAIAAQCPGTVAEDIGRHEQGDRRITRVEHPSGHLDVVIHLDPDQKVPDAIVSAGIVRTARPIMDGVAFV
ncbi:MAG: 4-oxalomesaconate tautomerase [Phycisphaerae bacterium]|nr:4-oxalomesaconate tautomerase [Phycisphaerae bacterium]